MFILKRKGVTTLSLLLLLSVFYSGRAQSVYEIGGQEEPDGGPTSVVSMRTTNDFKNATSFTVSYWLKMNPPSKSGAQFVWSNPTTSGEWPGANTFQLIEDGGQSNNGLIATKFVVHGNWMEFVIGGPPHSALGTTPDDWMTTFQGGVDQFRMYSKVLTDAEITALYNNKD